MVAEKTKGERFALYQNFADNWSVIGYRYVFYNSGFRRIFWVVLLLGSTILAAVLFYDSIVDYFDYQTYIVTNIDYNQDSLPFPSITFCNMNPQNVGGAKKRKLVKDLKEFKKLYAYLANDNSSKADSITTSEVLEWMKKNNISTHRQAINNLEYSFQEMASKSKISAILGYTCTFEDTPCTKDDMKDTMSWRHSLCYQFNPFNLAQTSRNSTIIGINGGLTIYLDLGSSDSELSTYPYKGMEIIMNPFGIPHALDKYNEAVFVSPGSMNVISIDISKTNLLQEPYSTNCTDGGTLKVLHTFPYSKPVCELDCILERIIEKCGCVSFEYSDFVNNASECTVEQLPCWFKHRDIYKKLHRSCDCQTECTIYRYKLSMSQSTMGNNDLYTTAKGKKGMSKSEAKDYLSENVVGFKISFRKLYVREDTVTPVVTWSTLLGNIGGNLGLCMGLSILTIFELIFFLYDFILILLGCGMRKAMDESTSQIKSETHDTKC